MKSKPYQIENVRIDKNFRAITDNFDTHKGLNVDPHGSILYQTDIFLKKPWVDVRAYGVRGDGITDDTVAIQTAIDSIRLNKDYIKDDGRDYTDTLCKGVLYFPPLKFLISSPLSFENDLTKSPKVWYDTIGIFGYGAELIASSSFTGVDRYYDATHTERINAMMIFGPKNYGKVGGKFQSYNSIYGLTFTARNVTGIDLNAIRFDICYMPTVSDCIFEQIHHAIDTRIMHYIIMNRNRYRNVNSMYYCNNDSKIIGWNGGIGYECGGPIISDFMCQGGKNLTNDTPYKNTGRIHLVNQGECAISNGKVLGGNGYGVFWKWDGDFTYRGKFNRLSNVEFGDIYYHGLYFQGLDKIEINNIGIADPQIQDHDSTVRPGVFFDDCQRIHLSNFTFHQNKPPASHNMGAWLLLKGGGCKIANGDMWGQPKTDGIYPCIRIEDGATYAGDYNKFSNIEVGGGYDFVSGNKFLTGVYEVVGKGDHNTFNHITITNVASTCLSINGANSKAFNIETDESRDIASATTITLLNHGEYFNITGTTNITSITPSWLGRIVILKFAGVLTLIDGGNLKLQGNFVTSADDCISLVCDGTNWYEVAERSPN